MDDQTLISQASQLPDNNGFVDPFFTDPRALQIRIDALWGSGNLSAKKATYIIQNIVPNIVEFPKELAGQIYLQLPAGEMTNREKLELVTSYFVEPSSEILKCIALGILDKESSTSILMVSRELNANLSTLFNFQLIANNVSSIGLLAHENWDRWLERIAEICALTIDTPKDKEFESFLSIVYRTFHETLELVEESDKDKLSAQIADAIFRHFPGDGEGQLHKAIDLANKLGIKDPEKYVRWQQIQSGATPDSIKTFGSLFENEPKVALAKFVTQSIAKFPESRIHGRLGNSLSQLLVDSEIDLETKKAIVDELKAYRTKFGSSTEALASSEFAAVDSTIRGLIINLVKKKQYPDSREIYTYLTIGSELRDYLIDSFKDDYLKMIIDSKLVDEDRAIELIAESLGADPKVIDRLTSSPNGLELLGALRQERTGIASTRTQLAQQREGFPSDAGQAWSIRS